MLIFAYYIVRFTKYAVCLPNHIPEELLNFVCFNKTSDFILNSRLCASRRARKISLMYEVNQVSALHTMHTQLVTDRMNLLVARTVLQIHD